MDWEIVGVRIRTLGSLAGFLVFVGGAISYTFDVIPYAKSSELAAVKADMSQVKTVLNSVLVEQKVSQELAWMERLDRLADRLQRISPDSPDYAEYRVQRVAAEQQLRVVRADLAAARASNR